MDVDALRRLALIGARARLVEIEQERESLLAEFPELRLAIRKPRGPIAKPSREPAVLFDAEEHAPKAKRGKREKRSAPGFARKGKSDRRTFTPEFRSEIIERIRRGEYLIDIAREYDVRESVIGRWCKAAGVPITRVPIEVRIERWKKSGGNANAARDGAKGAAHRSFRPGRPPELRAEALRRIAAGEKWGDVAKAMGLPKPTVYGWTKGKGSKLARDERQPDRQPGTKYPEGTRDEFKRRLAAGEKRAALARELGIKKSTSELWARAVRESAESNGED